MILAAITLSGWKLWLVLTLAAIGFLYVINKLAKILMLVLTAAVIIAAFILVGVLIFVSVT